MGMGFQFPPTGNPSMNEFEEFKEMMVAELRAVHSKFHNAKSSAPELDRLWVKPL